MNLVRLLDLIVNHVSYVWRTIILFSLDAIVSGFTLVTAVLFHFSLDNALHFYRDSWWLIVLYIAIRLGTFQNFGMYSCLWRYASVNEVIRVVQSVTAGTFLFMAVLFLIRGVSLPVSVIVMDWALNVVLVGAVRLGLRLLRDYYIRILAEPQDKSNLINLLIVGAGDAGEMIVREIQKSAISRYIIVGLVDDMPEKVGQFIHGIPVLGIANQLPELVAKHAVQEVIIAMPSAQGSTVRRIKGLCDASNVKCRITPRIYDIIDGKISVSQLRAVEIDDLLGRDVVETDLSEISQYLQNRIVLVTGGGGSIGSELCRQIVRFNPKILIIAEHGENALYHIDMELRTKTRGAIKIQSVIVDIRNRDRMAQLFEQLKPEIVFHAAAYKHVPLMEDNVEEVIMNNVLGTRNLIEISSAYQVQKCILISTDKAVNPTNCMGASKRLCEVLMQAEARRSNTIFSAVRFGNVLGSNGSVVPLFMRQIKAGGPITVTHPEVTRFFMTIPEAVRLVIQAGSFSTGGEIYILDMGEPVNITNLARDMIQLSGLEVGKDIAISYTGLRPGEKMYEELSYDIETLQPTRHSKIRLTHPLTYDVDQMYARIENLIQSVYNRDTESNRNLLMELAFDTQKEMVKQS